MNGKLNSLTDVLKKTLFFFEALTVAELAPHVQKKMLQDYSISQVEEKTSLCLEQHQCFSRTDKQQWFLVLEGHRENDQFYGLLLKRQQPLSLKEVFKNNAKKKKRKMVSEEASLISDGRFVQLDNGYWGLTEWEVENSRYSLKQMVIKAMKLHPGGLSLLQLHGVIKEWRPTDLKVLEEVLKKYPYFEQMGEGIWCYNASARIMYEAQLKRYLGVLNKQRRRWIQDRRKWQYKNEQLMNQLNEVAAAHRETAAALALRMEDLSRQDTILTQMAEKDLLLSLRKREIYRYKEHLHKLENKANSILHQCRLWVRRARDRDDDLALAREKLSRAQASLESLFGKLQQYKEKDRENKALVAELKEKQAIRVAELQTEVVDLKRRLERHQDMNLQGERHLREQLNILSNDLKNALDSGEELERSMRITRRELDQVTEENRLFKDQIRHPLVKLALRLCNLFRREVRETL
jgi:hypothetical protein